MGGYMVRRVTKAAEEKNAENLLIIHDKKLASLHTKNWQGHAQHSEVYPPSQKTTGFARGAPC
jgi:hypothetical protein